MGTATIGLHHPRPPTLRPVMALGLFALFVLAVLVIAVALTAASQPALPSQSPASPGTVPREGHPLPRPSAVLGQSGVQPDGQACPSSSG